MLIGRKSRAELIIFTVSPFTVQSQAGGRSRSTWVQKKWVEWCRPSSWGHLVAKIRYCKGNCYVLKVSITAKTSLNWLFNYILLACCFSSDGLREKKVHHFAAQRHRSEKEMRPCCSALSNQSDLFVYKLACTWEITDETFMFCFRFLLAPCVHNVAVSPVAQHVGL